MEKPYAPHRLAELPEKRLYTRYSFTAEAEISGSGAVMSSQVMNISFGGCRLLLHGRLEVGATVTIKIHTPTESFEATAKAVHSTENEAGVMFDKISPESLFVLQKWINAAKSAPTATTGG
jgi:PilZ domain